jgi:hypothetical protein
VTDVVGPRISFSFASLTTTPLLSRPFSKPTQVLQPKGAWKMKRLVPIPPESDNRLKRDEETGIGYHIV